jgi:hypothetical protein
MSESKLLYNRYNKGITISPHPNSRHKNKQTMNVNFCNCNPKKLETKKSSDSERQFISKQNKQKNKNNDCLKNNDNSNKKMKYDQYNKHHKNVKLSITDISPKIGPDNNEIKIFGHGFTKVTSVNVGKINIKQFKIVNDKLIIVHMSNMNGIDCAIGAEGNIYISVSTNKYTSNGMFYKVVDVPVITSIDPLSGPIGPLTNITIYGKNLSTIKSISYGDTVLNALNTSAVSIISDTMTSFIIPQNDYTYNVPISVTTLGGTSNKVYYTYIPVPVI